MGSAVLPNFRTVLKQGMQPAYLHHSRLNLRLITSWFGNMDLADSLILQLSRSPYLGPSESTWPNHIADKEPIPWSFHSSRTLLMSQYQINIYYWILIEAILEVSDTDTVLASLQFLKISRQIVLSCTKRKKIRITEWAHTAFIFVSN